MPTAAGCALAARQNAGAPPVGGITLVGSGFIQVDDTDANDIQVTLPTIQADDVGIFYGRADEAGTIPVLSLDTGWTPEDTQNPVTGRDRVEYLWVERLAGTETTIDMSITIAEERSFGYSIYRGVHATTALDTAVLFDDDQNLSTPTPSPITTVTDNAAIVLLHGHTHQLITTPGAPSGYTMSVECTNYHRQQYHAHLLDAGTAGLKSPGAWTHVASAETGEYSTWSIALRPA